MDTRIAQRDPPRCNRRHLESLARRGERHGDVGLVASEDFPAAEVAAIGNRFEFLGAERRLRLASDVCELCSIRAIIRYQERRFCPMLAMSLMPSVATLKGDIAHFGFAPSADVASRDQTSATMRS